MNLNNRYEFVLYFDVKDGNPNGDPDAGNSPRVDTETGQGLVTDVCLKRKIRNYISLTKNNDIGYDIYIKEKAILNLQNEKAYKAIGETEELTKEDKKRKGGDKVETAKKWMCQNFFDVRTFGAVMSTGVNCGQVRGPVQLTFSRSIDPIISSEHSITRMAVATEKEAEKQDGDNRTIGRKHTIPYGLYRCHGFISPALANQTGFNQDDLEHFFTALEQMFDHDRSASKGEMATRALIIFKHESSLGNAPAYKLFDLVEAKNKDSSKPARSIHDYDLSINEANIPAKVELIKRIDW
jgi:CRISPR-associated protein Csd2